MLYNNLTFSLSHMRYKVNTQPFMSNLTRMAVENMGLSSFTSQKRCKFSVAAVWSGVLSQAIALKNAIKIPQLLLPVFHFSPFLPLRE